LGRFFDTIITTGRIRIHECWYFRFDYERLLALLVFGERTLRRPAQRRRRGVSGRQGH
jgi:hypothetical protein